MKTKTKKIVLVTAGLFLAILLIFTIKWTFEVISEIKKLDLLVSEAKSLYVDELNKSDIENAHQIAIEAKSSLDKLKIDLVVMSPLLKFGEGVPGIGPKIKILEPSLNLASNLVDAAVVLGQISEQLFEKDAFSKSSSPYQQLNVFLDNNQEKFTLVEESLLKALSARELIDPQQIPGKYKNDFSKIDQYLSEIPKVLQFIDSVPSLLGSDKAMTYLLLVQNRDELRATGGFITAFGLVKIKEGRILALKIEDSTLDKYNYVSEIIEPPYPLNALMFSNYLVPRDANWSPDFPTAAKQTQELHFLSTGIITDSVIAINQQFIIDLLSFTGPISLPEENFPISAENVEMRMIEYKQAAIKNNSFSERKDFLSILGPLLVNKILEYRDLNDLVNLGKLLLEEIQKGHLLIFVNDPEIEELLQHTGYDGAVQPGNGDYLLVIDSNVGFSKADQFIKRSINYYVDLEDPLFPKAEIQLTYKHTRPGIETCTQGLTGLYKYDGSSDYDFSRCYWDYWRVYTKGGTKFENISLELIPEEYFSHDTKWDQKIELGIGENDTSMAGGLIVVKQNSTQQITLKTILPEDILIKKENKDFVYTLRVQKQPGTNLLPLRIEIKFPTGYQLINQMDGWERIRSENILIWNGFIDRTTDYSLEFFAEK